MAKKVATKKTAKKSSAWVFDKMQSPFSVYWEKKNYLLLALAIALLVIGYILLSVDPWHSSTSLVAAPIVLLIAYIVLVPLAILLSGKGKKEESEKESPAK